MTDLKARVESWLADDPDPACRAELRELLDRWPESEPELADRFSGPLTFGTAGLRGVMRAGPYGMNQAVVRAAAAGLVRWLAARDAIGPLVIGYDARHGSRRFAEETAKVAEGAGRRTVLLHRPLPTPVLAYAVRALNAAAGVMVTASHNPPRDNGYKVYLGAELGGPRGAGAQIVPPVDTEISEAIAAVGSLADVPLGEFAVDAVLGEGVLEGYLSGAVDVVAPGGPRDLTVAYTPLHGVGARVLTDAFVRAGFAAPVSVAEQADPDPDFPTVGFPNPEEPGAMDRLLELAERIGADVAIANDPDADRCAVAIPTGQRQPRIGTVGSADHDGTATGWRVLRGDEVGVLLADHLMRRGVPGRYATTIVSSSLLRALCAARDVPYGETLTGFKWIVRAGGSQPEPLAYGYEEALGYCVAPDHVRDKDGITAALLVAELAAALKAEGRGLDDRLDELSREFGVHTTDQLSVRVDDLAEITAMMARLRQSPPRSLVGEPITQLRDLLPETDAVTMRTDGAKVVVRPSGTEPKLKAYLEVVEPVADDDVAAARHRATERIAELRTEVATALGVA